MKGRDASWGDLGQAGWARPCVTLNGVAMVLVARAADGHGWHAWLFNGSYTYLLTHDNLPRLFPTGSEASGFIDAVELGEAGDLTMLPGNHLWERFE